MLDIPAPTVARAIGILRSGPLTAAQFAQRMWPERSADRTPGQRSRSGHALLRQIAQVGYVQQVGDLWMLRTVGTAVGLGNSAVQTAVPTAVELPVAPAIGLADGLPIGPADGLPDGLPERLPNEPPRTEAERRADRNRLHRLVQLASEPVDTVTHDQALGDIAIRGEFLDYCLAEAAVYVVLAGHAMNVYLPGADARMIVALKPIEAARALYVRWQQSGASPELPHYEGWLFAADGAIADPCCWLPEYREPGIYFDLEPIDEQIRRQRAEAGLA